MTGQIPSPWTWLVLFEQTGCPISTDPKHPTGIWINAAGTIIWR
jgi:hypothetical protein